MNGLSVTSQSLDFYSVYTEGDLRVRQFGMDADTTFQTFTDFVATARARIMSKDGNISNIVVLSAQYFTGVTAGTLANSQNITLVHESLHVNTGLNDIDLASKLGLGPFQNDQAGNSAASASISLWLNYGCPPR